MITNHNFLAVYFDHRHKDLKLLLNLLAETSGLPESFRILTLFDKKFQSLWKPQNLRFEEYETVGSVTQVNTGIPQFTLLMWGHIKNCGKRKPRKLRLLSSTKGEKNRIEF